MAKKFQFPLQAVLQYRELIEDNKRKAFAEANRAVEEEEQQQQQMRDMRLQTQDQVRDLFNAGEPFSMVMDSYRYMNTLDMGLMHSARKIQGLEKIREDKKKVFLDARRDREALDILKDRQKEEHRKAEQKEEQKLLDELSIVSRRLREKDGA